jgi:hypothetical protein
MTRHPTQYLFVAALSVFLLGGCAGRFGGERENAQILKVFPYPNYAIAPVIYQIVQKLNLNVDKTLSEGAGIRVVFKGSASAPGRGEPGSVSVQPMNNRQTAVTVTGGRHNKNQPAPDADPELAQAIFRSIDATVRANL